MAWDERIIKVQWIGFNGRDDQVAEEESEKFEKTYHRRSIVESVFSSFKCRFTAVVRAKTCRKSPSMVI